MVVEGDGLGPDVRFSIEWEPAEGVRTPELRATWARLAISLGDEVVTQVEDARSGSVRRSIYVPLYPLAEWIAYNWWFLRADRRPAAFPTYERSFRRRVGRRSDTEWLTHHNLRGIGDGFLWPDLTIVPVSAETSMIAWRGDRSFPPTSQLRFLADGQMEVPSNILQDVLANVVESVLTRLTERGITATPLEEEWAELKSLDEDEVEYCTAVARLGLDPFGVTDGLSDVILRARSVLSTGVLHDFLDAVDTTKLEADLAWVSEASDIVERSAASSEPLPAIDTSREPGRKPWEVGLADARLVRSQLGIDPMELVDPRRWVAIEHVSRVDRSLHGLGGRSAGASTVLALAGSRPREAERFATARALWRALHVNGDASFLLTSAHSPTQQAERAFAAEFLAPSAALASLISPDEIVDRDEVAAAGEHFLVNEWVVEYQLINQLDREVDDPTLAR